MPRRNKTEISYPGPVLRQRTMRIEGLSQIVEGNRIIEEVDVEEKIYKTETNGKGPSAATAVC